MPCFIEFVHLSSSSGSSFNSTRDEPMYDEEDASSARDALAMEGQLPGRMNKKPTETHTHAHLGDLPRRTVRRP